MVGLMTETLELRGGERVLEVGTGCGYQTAVLAELAGTVFTIERIAALAAAARMRLEAAGYTNVATRVGDGSLGWSEAAPFDAVIVTAGTPQVPRPLVAQLATGGRLVFPIGEDELQTLVRIRKDEAGLREEYFGDCRFVKLVGRYGWRREE
jgi:protein-L-isoaspartate(D-aspartate) O-methyltransferase